MTALRKEFPSVFFFLSLLAFLGLLHTNSLGKNKMANKLTRFTNSLFVTTLLAYFILTLSWIQLKDGFTSRLVTAVLTNLWTCNMFFVALLMSFACRKGGIYCFLNGFCQYRRRYVSEEPKRSMVYMIRVIICGALFTTLSSVGFTVYSMSQTSRNDRRKFNVGHIESESLAMGIVWATDILQLVAMPVWQLPFFLSTILQIFIIAEFRRLNRELKDCISKQSTIYESGMFESYRHRFMCLVKVFSLLDNAISPLIGIQLLFSIPIVCFLIYNVLLNSQSVIPPAVIAFYIFGNCIQLLVTILPACIIFDKAHESFDEILSIDQERAPDKTNAQIQSILLKLGQGDIGLTAGGFFVINKNSVLTLFGTIISYFVVLIQFGSPDFVKLNLPINETIQATA